MDPLKGYFAGSQSFYLNHMIPIVISPHSCPGFRPPRAQQPDRVRLAESVLCISCVSTDYFSIMQAFTITSGIGQKEPAMCLCLGGI